MMRWTWLIVALGVLLAGCGQGADSAGGGGAASESASTSAEPSAPADDAQATTRAYVEQFYPLWLSHSQSKFAPKNELVGPDKISPVYQAVVAINNDTLYASTLVELADEPVVVTIPATPATYSMLTLSPYGDIFDSGVAPQTPGTYAFTGPNWQGELPDGVTPVSMPLDFSVLIFRADKYTAEGQDVTQEADEFRRSLQLATLSDYLNDPTAGATQIVPEAYFAAPFKTVVDNLIATDPIAFLTQLQEAVASTNTPPMTAAEQALSDQFNDLFDAAKSAEEDLESFATGAQEAHSAILDTYLNNRGPTNWITFTNIGDWGDAVVQRSAIAEFIQWANDRSTAAYYQAFVDGQGASLDGADARYTVTFSADQIPAAKRFWSLTAYTPEAIELVPNAAEKYVVASYTPGLQTNPDGSLTIHLATEQPEGVAEANWLPIPSGPFNIMLRVYGPEGSVADNSYVPPAVALEPSAGRTADPTS